jgi:alkylation response protein AidB-like acyl-CoA dehydrogenase
MDFSLSEEQQSAQQLAQKILGDHTAVEQLANIEQQPERFDRSLWQALAEAGLLGLAINQEYGGMGFGFYSLCTLCEEVGRTVAPLPVIPVLVSAAATLQKYGSSEQRQRWLPAIASGEALVTAALEEYNNDDPTKPGATATKDTNGWHLAGSKICVPLATTAERVLLSAHTDDGIIAVLVDPGASGVQLNPQVVTSGDTRYEMVLDNVSVTDNDLVASGQRAHDAMQWSQQATRTALSAAAVGLCDKMMRMTGQYTSERQQFGRAIATFQAVSHRMADCFIDVECLRLVTQQAASLIDQDRPAEEAVSIAKIWCGDVTHRVSQAAQHCHGGTGVDRDYPLFRYCLWARQIELSAGSSARLTGELGQAITAQYL